MCITIIEDLRFMIEYGVDLYEYNKMGVNLMIFNI